MVRKLFAIVTTVATLTSFAHAADFEKCLGFASIDGTGKQSLKGGVTGGAGGPVVEVSTFADLEKYCGMHGPYTIVVKGTIALPINTVPAGKALDGSQSSLYGVVLVQSNKTIIGSGAGATLTGG